MEIRWMGGSKNCYVFGSTNASDGIALYVRPKGTWVVTNYKAVSTASKPDGNWHTLKVYGAKWVELDEQHMNVTGPVTAVNDTPMTLFKDALVGGPTPNCKIAYFKVWDNEILTHHMKACKDSSNRPAMYDLITGDYFYNLGTGEFTTGPDILPDTYKVKRTSMKSVADAIRTKGSTTAPLTFPDGMVKAINDIQAGGGGVELMPMWKSTEYIFGYNRSGQFVQGDPVSYGDKYIVVKEGDKWRLLTKSECNEIKYTPSQIPDYGDPLYSTITIDGTTEQMMFVMMEWRGKKGILPIIGPSVPY